jgi:hypothetical protein
MPELAQCGENVPEYVLTFLASTYPIFNPLLGDTYRLTIAMHLSQ